MCAAVLLGVVAGKVLSLAEREVVAAALLPSAAAPLTAPAAPLTAPAAPLAAPAAAAAVPPALAAAPAAAPLVALAAAPLRRTISTLNHFYLVPILKIKVIG